MTATSDGLGPPSPPGALEWIRKNLFSNWYNSVLTILGATVVYFTLITSSPGWLPLQTGVR